jgi:hypothetical protein
MDPERRRQPEKPYHAARERSPEARAALLEQADADLRQEVQSLTSRCFLCAGGMGQVYDAYDFRLRGAVAMKFGVERFSQVLAGARLHLAAGSLDACI